MNSLLHARDHQRGAALIIGLIMLLILTLLGVTAISNVTLQERMSGSLADRSRAFQAAEIALRQAEDHVNGKISPQPDEGESEDDEEGEEGGEDEGQAGLYDLNTGNPQPDPYDLSKWDEGYLASSDINGLSTAARYRIERQIKISDSQPTMYRLTAIGYGNRPGTSVVLQTTFSVPAF